MAPAVVPFTLALGVVVVLLLPFRAAVGILGGILSCGCSGRAWGLDLRSQLRAFPDMLAAQRWRER